MGRDNYMNIYLQIIQQNKLLKIRQGGFGTYILQNYA